MISAHSDNSNATDPGVAFSYVPSELQLELLRRIESDAKYLSFSTSVAMQGDDIDVHTMKAVLQKTVIRHAALRTVFRRETTPVGDSTEWQAIELRELDSDKYFEVQPSCANIEQAMQMLCDTPFDIGSCLFRVQLLRDSSARLVLVFCVHRLIADFVSMAVLLDDLRVMYHIARYDSRLSLPPLSIQVPRGIILHNIVM